MLDRAQPPLSLGRCPWDAAGHTHTELATGCTQVRS